MKLELDLVEESNSRLGGDVISAQPAPQKQKYIPPAYRGSSDGSISKTQVSETSNGQNRSNSKTKELSRDSSPQWPRRSPSPIGPASAGSKNPLDSSQQNKSKIEAAEVWQEKRKGGNRAPKIEPAETKNWRTPEPKVQPKITFLKRQFEAPSLDSRDGEDTGPLPPAPHVGKMSNGPLSRWPMYPSLLLDVIDMHLNVLIQCISPGEAKFSFRCSSTEAPMCTSFHIPSSLPRGMSKEDFQNLAKVIMNGILKLPSSALEYLVECEQGRKRGWPMPRELHSQLYGLAVAQINEACATHVLNARFTEIPAGQRDDLRSRQYLLANEENPIMSYMLKYSTSNTRNSQLMVEMEQLVQDRQNGDLSAEQLRTWNTCISYQWLGKVQALPNYLALLQAAGFLPGKRIPAQIVHPREPSRVFDTVAGWMEIIKLEETQAWNYSLPSPEVRNYLNTVEWKEQVKQDWKREEYCVDFANSLSLNRNWRNQFMV